MTAFEEDDDINKCVNCLPDEIIIYIFKYLPLESLLTCEDVCFRWRSLVRDTSIWRQILIIYSGKPGQSEVSKKNLDIITTHSEYIYNLKLQYVYSYPFIKSVIEKCDHLMSLELVMCRVAKEFEDDIMRWPHLKKLNLKNSIILVSNEDVFIQYDNFKELHYLALSDFGLSSVNCDSLLNCTNLTHILIEKIKNLSIEFVTELILSHQNIIETLHIYGGDTINNESLNLLSKCPSLRDLAIIRCESLTDEGLLNLANFKKIEHLQIWNNYNFTEVNLLRTLSSNNLIKLQSLSLSRIGNISPVIVDVISEYYKTLKFLAVYQCPRIINTDYMKQLKSKFRNIDVVLY